MGKILSVLSELNKDFGSYCNFNLHLAKDNNQYLDFIYNYEVQTPVTPAPITGSGLSYPESISVNRNISHQERELKEFLLPYKKSYRKVNYLIGKGSLIDKVNIQTYKKNYFLCTMMKTNDDSWWNVLFGTKETRLSKETEIPCLYIPYKFVYSKPRELMMFVNNYDREVFDKLKNIAQKLSLKVRIVVENNIGRKHLKLIQAELANCHEFDTMIIELKPDQFEEHYFNALVKKFKVDWIGFANYDKSLFERLYSINENRLLLQSEIPTLIV